MKRNLNSAFSEYINECYYNRGPGEKFHGVNCAEYANRKMEEEFGRQYLAKNADLKARYEDALVRNTKYLLHHEITEHEVSDITKPISQGAKRNMQVDWGIFLSFYRTNGIQSENAAESAVKEMKKKYGDDFMNYADMTLRNDIEVNIHREENRVKKLSDPSLWKKVTEPGRNIWQANLNITESIKSLTSGAKNVSTDLEDFTKDTENLKTGLYIIVGIAFLAAGGYAAAEITTAYKNMS